MLRFLDLMTYSADEIRVATNNLSPGNLLGCGAFGKVYHGRMRHTDVAIKGFERGQFHVQYLNPEIIHPDH